MKAVIICFAALFVSFGSNVSQMLSLPTLFNTVEFQRQQISRDALKVQQDKLDQCEKQVCSSQTQKIVQSIETGKDTFSAYTSYSDCMNPCLAKSVRCLLETTRRLSTTALLEEPNAKSYQLTLRIRELNNTDNFHQSFAYHSGEQFPFCVHSNVEKLHPQSNYALQTACSPNVLESLYASVIKCNMTFVSAVANFFSGQNWLISNPAAPHTKTTIRKKPAQCTSSTLNCPLLSKYFCSFGCTAGQVNCPFDSATTKADSNHTADICPITIKQNYNIIIIDQKQNNNHLHLHQKPYSSNPERCDPHVQRSVSGSHDVRSVSLFPVAEISTLPFFAPIHLPILSTWTVLLGPMLYRRTDFLPSNTSSNTHFPH
ncbi:hypothetical protein Tsp_00351 [Trichinella spiralis]|uniref:hypothetical protein n=1 Tax=Trichinella spiralis TaxID=6334 RepID=UPI0001EFD023|nr:hypothetical protein Tsp_00351 [Trichinella spiralis]